MTDFTTRRRMMVDTQVRPSDVTEFPIINAMLTTPREAYVPRERIEAAYADAHMDLGDGRVVLEPRLFAKMLDALNLTNQDLVLDIGAGLGYSSAVMACICEAVVALEDDSERAQEAQAQWGDHGVDNVISQVGELAAGAAEHGPYDAIILQGGVQELPDAIADQLKEHGRIAALFMEGAVGTVRIGHKLDGVINWRFAFNGTAPVLPGFEKQVAFAL
ncbi:MAG: protein-L-isoaspartate O-methyltransferase [Pelagimonas sp.]|jgi:protein-L-isoaspartate(D-aspartate) O-methyltransferase|nr:protein-L-isoaspartate O-methyltransferase [Pelagimonas sp.]